MLVIVVLRVVVGLSTLGTFSPVLLSFGYTQAGLGLGLTLAAAVLLLGVLAQPVLRHLRMPRVARLTVLIGLVTLLLLGVQEFAGLSGAADSWGAALPVVVTAVIIERLWEVWDLDGTRTALSEAAITPGVAVLVTVLLLAPVTRLLAGTAPLPLALGCTRLAGVIGADKGLRLVDLVRFSPLTRSETS